MAKHRTARQLLNELRCRVSVRKLEECKELIEEIDAYFSANRNETLSVDNAAHLLLDAMRKVSELYWAAGWLISLEYILWEVVHRQRISESILGENDADGEWHRGGLGEDEINLLRELSELADGWWYWDDDQHEPKFESLADFSKRYSAHISKVNRV